MKPPSGRNGRVKTLAPGSTDEDDSAVLDHDLDPEEQEGMGTVGAVALDAHGRLAAATSTGGMTGKPVGRIGDTPIIGAGTWCDQTVAVSCTGVGEAFIRTCAAHELAVQLRQPDASLLEASHRVLEMVNPMGGRGGLIAVSADGQVVMPFQTMLMYRGLWHNGALTTGIGEETVFRLNSVLQALGILWEKRQTGNYASCINNYSL